MKIGGIYSHMNGLEWLQIHAVGIWQELQEVIAGVDAESCRTKKSREKRIKGRMLFSPDDLNKAFRDGFQSRGWQERRVSYYVTDDERLIRSIMHLPHQEQRSAIIAAGKAPLLSYNQTDFQKDRVSIEIQFGKYSFVAYDLSVKHLAFYIGDIIDVGVEILPMKTLQSEMSSGVPYYEKCLYDIVRQGRGSPAVPIVVIGIEP